jgi:hypothetical protein
MFEVDDAGPEHEDRDHKSSVSNNFANTRRLLRLEAKFKFVEENISSYVSRSVCFKPLLPNN